MSPQREPWQIGIQDHDSREATRCAAGLQPVRGNLQYELQVNEHLSPFLTARRSYPVDAPGLREHAIISDLQAMEKFGPAWRPRQLLARIGTEKDIEGAHSNR